MIQVSVREARQRWAKLISSAQAGETIEVTRRGKAVARIVPPQPAPRRKLPDLTAFHKTLKMTGSPMSQTGFEIRRQVRY
jgi:prevent-host-death family protein